MRLRAISKYIDLLLKWNARINLTAIRDPKEIVQRHFGESLFAARYFLEQKPVGTAIDLGSGAGFPGVPFALLSPDIQVTLIESQNKKATFLKELISLLELKNVKVFGGRAENYLGTADLVLLRAVEKFEKALQLAVSLTAVGGRVGLMIGSAQVNLARNLAPTMGWEEAVQIPSGHSRDILVGTKDSKGRVI